MTILSRFDLNLLVVFDAIYDCGGITRAADRLNLTQSAVSHALARLREGVGDKLFVRDGQLMLPTPMAQDLIGPVRRALGDIEMSLRRAQVFDPLTTSRRIQIGMRGFLETVIFPPLAAHLTADMPQARLSAVRHNRDGLQAALGSGELDLAIDVALPGQDQTRRSLLWRSQMVVLMRRGHPAAAGLDLAGYLALGHVAASSRDRGDSMEDTVLRRLGVERQVRMRCQNHMTASRIVAQSDLVLTAPVSYAPTLAALFDLVSVPAPAGLTSPDLFLYWYVHLDKDPANLWLRTAVLGCLERLFDLTPSLEITSLEITGAD